jgi:ubiquinone/menaquinone biosynthesis C-methylase UbiE
LENRKADLSEETHWEKAAKTRMGKYLTRLEMDFVRKSFDTSEAHLIVDVGAEAGRFSLTAANSDATVIGLDIDAYSLRRLKLKSKDVNVIQADARRIPLRDGIFDAVLMIEVLDYIPEVAETFGECSRILKPSHPLLLSFGNQSSLKAKLRWLRGKSYLHTYGKIMQCLLKAGFTVTRKMGYSWLPFGRTSESRLVPFLAGVERLFGLRRMPSLSPWVMLCAVTSD